MVNLLQNPGFEGDWWRKTFTGQEYGEIFVPRQWVAYWKEGGPVPHDPANQDGYGRPEMHVINREPPFLDPPRIHSGQRALKYFTFWRIHDAGVYQQVGNVTPGTALRGTGWGHAWSSQGDDPDVSEGVGDGPFFVLARNVGANVPDAVRNVSFRVGIDPRGGTDPWSTTVVWGEAAHIYNDYAQIPPVEAVAQSDTVTFFVRTSVLWPFKHNDVYLDDMALTPLDSPPPRDFLRISLEPKTPVQGEPFDVVAEGNVALAALTLRFEGGDVLCGPLELSGDRARWECVASGSGRHTAEVSSPEGILRSRNFTVEQGASTDWAPPRVDYDRIYILLPPDAGAAWFQAVADSGIWERYRWTVGGSADDAGTGPASRRVIAVNPQSWPSDLEAFFRRYYPGVNYDVIAAATPADLARVLRAL